MDLFPLANSLRVAAASTVVVFLLGIALANVVSRAPRVVCGLADVVLTLPLVLPPTVVGFLLLMLLGPRRPLGAWALSALGDQTLADAARTLGRSNAWVFWHVKMPCCRQGIVAGAVLAFARALGEYGATSMVCGYMPGSTATVSTTVYQLWRTGDNAGCVVLVALNVVQGRTAGGRGAASFSPARGAAEGDAR